MKTSIDNIIKDIIETTIKTCLKEMVDDIKAIHHKNKTDDKLLTISETCEFLNISITTLWRWTKSGRIKAYGINGKRFYKKDDIFDALIPLKTAKI